MCQVLIVLVSVCALAYGSIIRKAAPNLTDRIVGGSAANIEDFPWMVSLQRNGSHICGASIVSENCVATAAHCVNGSDPAWFTLRAGSSTRGSGGYLRQAANITTHPLYDSNTDYDVATICFSERLPLGQPGVQAIGLAGVEPPADTECIATGWGTILPGGPLSVQLQSVNLKIVSRAYCKTRYVLYSITDRMICAGDMPVGLKDTCQGDSGGPLVCQGKLAGIVSWGELCGVPLTPGVYTNVAYLIKWILQNAGLL